MTKFSLSLLLLIFVCYFTIATADSSFRPSSQNRSLGAVRRKCYSEPKLVCVHYFTGSVKEKEEVLKCPPFGFNIKAVRVGKCQPKSQ